MKNSDLINFMKTRQLTPLLSLAFVFLFSGSVCGGDWDDGVDAYKNNDYKTAYKLWLSLAGQGDADAQHNIGSMYDNGIGVLRDYKEAVKWYRLSAEQGNAKAQFNLGLMLGDGRGVPINNKEAFKWYRLSAEQGHADAQYNLGLMYVRGVGVLQNHLLAHMWWNIAGASGLENAIENRSIVEKEMTPSQIEEAQEMARNWKPKVK